MPRAARMIYCVLLLALLAGCGSAASTGYYRNEELRDEEGSLDYQLTYDTDSSDFYFDETFFDMRFSLFDDAYYSFAVTIISQSDHPLTIDWNQVEYVDVGGTPHSVVHQGVPYGSPLLAQKPTVVPSGVTVQDEIRPADRRLLDGELHLVRPLRTPAAENWSDAVTLVIPVKSEGLWRNYRLALPVGQVSTDPNLFDPFW